MSNTAVHEFGMVDPMGDYYELFWGTGKTGQCRLEGIVQTERGPRRGELAVISADLWRAVCERVIRELSEGMGERERSKKVPGLKRGINRLSPLIGRELAVLFWALMEAEGEGPTETILHGWRELAREERWWLYAKAAAPGQDRGAGWRLALFHALSKSFDSRAAELATPEKKTPGNGSPSAGKASTKRNPAKQQLLPIPKPVISSKRLASPRTKKPPVRPGALTEEQAKPRKAAGKRAKRKTRRAAQHS